MDYVHSITMIIRKDYSDIIRMITVMKILITVIQINNTAAVYHRNQGLITVIDATESRR